MAEPLPAMPGAPTNMSNPFDGTSSSSPSADPAAAPSSTPSAAAEAQPHLPMPSSPPDAVVAGDAAGRASPFEASPISSAAAEHAGASTTPTNAPSGAHAMGAATPEETAINDLLPDLDPNDPELTIEEQCDYAEFFRNMMAASRPLSARKQQLEGQGLTPHNQIRALMSPSSALSVEATDSPRDGGGRIDGGGGIEDSVGGGRGGNASELLSRFNEESGSPSNGGSSGIGIGSGLDGDASIMADGDTSLLTMDSPTSLASAIDKYAPNALATDAAVAAGAGATANGGGDGGGTRGGGAASDVAKVEAVHMLFQEELLDEISVLERQKEQTERENAELLERLRNAERENQTLRKERDVAVGECAVAVGEAERLKQAGGGAPAAPQTPPAPPPALAVPTQELASDLEADLVSLRAELTETTMYKEKLIADKNELQRGLAERETELQQARTAQKDAEQTNLRIATVVAEVKMKLAEEQAAREDAEITMQHAVREKIQYMEELEELKNQYQTSYQPDTSNWSFS